MLRVVSLGVPSALCCRPSTISAGFSENTLKNENGAALTTPAGDERRHQRDGARHHQPAQQLVALARLEIGETQAEIGHQASGGSFTPTWLVIGP